MKDYLLLPHAWRQPGFVLGLHGLFAVALAASVLQLQRALRGGKGLRGEARDPLAADPLRGTFRGVG